MASNAATQSTGRLKIGVLGSPGYIREPERFDTTQTLHILGQNSGNLLFQYAATKLFDAEFVHFGMSETNYAQAAGANFDFMVFPAANHLRAGADWTHLVNFIRQIRCPVIILGLGAQSETLGGDEETINTLKADASVRALADVFKEKAAYITVRGEYTAKVCRALEIPNVYVMGCPSAMINADLNLGETIAATLARFRIGGGNVAATAAAPFEIRNNPEKSAIEQKLVQLIDNGNSIYVQQSGGETVFNLFSNNGEEITPSAMESMRKILNPKSTPNEFSDFVSKRGRIYVDVRRWIEDLSRVSLAIGTRIHGNMAAIAAGIPGILIAHDSRTSELAETMRIPILSASNLVGAETLTSAIAKVEFSAAEFDNWRLQTAKTYVEKFKELGVAPSTQLMRLAAIDNCP